MKKDKAFDAVKMMRENRDRMSEENEKNDCEGADRIYREEVRIAKRKEETSGYCI